MAAEQNLTKELQEGTLYRTPWGQIIKGPKQGVPELKEGDVLFGAGGGLVKIPKAKPKPKPKPPAPKPAPAPTPAPEQPPAGQQYAPVAPQRTVHMPQPSLPPLPRVSLPYQQLPPMQSGYEPQPGQQAPHGQYPQPYGQQPQGLMPQGLMPQQQSLQQIAPQYQLIPQYQPMPQYQPQYQQPMQPQYQQYQQPQGSSMVAPGQMVSYGQPQQQQQHPMSGILGIVNQILGGL